jgi:hypothetical protein
MRGSKSKLDGEDSDSDGSDKHFSVPDSYFLDKIKDKRKTNVDYLQKNTY